MDCYSIFSARDCPIPGLYSIFVKPLAPERGAGEEFLKSAAKTAGNSAGKKAVPHSFVAQGVRHCSQHSEGTPLFPGTVPGNPSGTPLFPGIRNSSPAPLPGASGFTTTSSVHRVPPILEVAIFSRHAVPTSRNVQYFHPGMYDGFIARRPLSRPET